MSEASGKKKDGGVWGWIAARVWRIRWGIREIYAADRQTYWSRALIYWNTFRPAWPIIAGCAFVIGVSLATSQGREALDYAVNLQGDPRSLMRVITSAVALLVFSITAHELALRVVNVHYYFSERASPLLRPRIRFAVIAGLVVPVAFALYFLARLGDAAAPEHGAGGLPGAVLLVDGFLEDHGQLMVGIVVLVQIASAFYDFVGPSWRGSLEGAARLAEKVVIFTLRMGWLAVFLGFAWYYVASPAIALGLNFPRLPSNSPLYGLTISGAVIALTIALIVLSHSRVSLRRYYSHTDQFVVFRRGHTQVSWTVLIGLMLTFLAAMIFPVEVSGAIGPIATALVCAMGLILVFTAGSVMTALGRGVPASLIVLLILIIAPMLNSTRLHDLQLVPALQAGERIMPVGEYAAKWKETHPDSDMAIVVLAEGGGIRAAVHTAALLSCLDQMDSGFVSKVYAMSGVSGGAVGIAAFLAAKADIERTDESPGGLSGPCRFPVTIDLDSGVRIADPGPGLEVAGNRIVQRGAGIEAATANYLQADLFSPTLSTLLLRDFPFQSTLCALLPCNGIIEDRAGVFERAMDTAYWDAAFPKRFRDAHAADRAAHPGDFGLRREFLTVVEKAAAEAQQNDGSTAGQAETAKLPPIVIFNTFDAGRGLPAIVSNVLLAEQASATDDGLPSFYNILRTVPNRSVSMVTASHLSARFPLASPPGRIESIPESENGGRKDCGAVGAVCVGPFVDGGYFDNSGAASAVRAVQALKAVDPNRRILILHILYRDPPTERGPNEEPSRMPPLFEFSTPAQAVLKARMLHGDSPIEQLCLASATIPLREIVLGVSRLADHGMTEEELADILETRDRRARERIVRNCFDLNAWLASVPLPDEPREFRFPFEVGDADVEWIRSPLQLPSQKLAKNDDDQVELPLGWLVGDAGQTILLRVAEHARDVDRELNLPRPIGRQSGDAQRRPRPSRP